MHFGTKFRFLTLFLFQCYTFWGALALSLGVSVFWVLAFESPVIVAEKYFLEKGRTQSKNQKVRLVKLNLIYKSWLTILFYFLFQETADIKRHPTENNVDGHKIENGMEYKTQEIPQVIGLLLFVYNRIFY